MSIECLSVPGRPSLALGPGLNIIEAPGREALAPWLASLEALPPAARIGSAGGDAGERAAALLTTGSETDSFSAASRALRQLRERRRRDDAGLIPQTEREIASLRALLERQDPLAQTAVQDQQALTALREERRQLEKQLARHDAADQADELRAVELARLDAASARDRLKTLESSARALPSRRELDALQERVDSLASINWSAAEAKGRLDTAARALQEAEDAMEAHPFAGMTPQEAADAPLNPEPPPKFSLLLPFLAALAGLTLGGVIIWTSQLWPAAVGAGLGLFGVISVGAVYLFRREQARWKDACRRMTQQRADAVAAYTPLYEEAARALAAYQTAKAAWETVSAAAKANLDAILTPLRSFRPMVRNLEEACRALDLAYEMRGELDLAARREEQARRRWEELRQDAPPIPTESALRPEASREELRRRLALLEEQEPVLLQRLQDAREHLRTLGDPRAMSQHLQELENRRERLLLEYDAAGLAEETLAGVNQALAADFFPALRETAAAIFTKLLGEGYNSKAAPAGAVPPLPGDAGGLLPLTAEQLSRGSGGQLYLAVRLALLEASEPEDTPLALEDALTGFEPQPMAAALDYLLELSRDRQILLFTSRRGEGDYLNWAYPERFQYFTCEESL